MRENSGQWRTKDGKAGIESSGKMGLPELGSDGRRKARDRVVGLSFKQRVELKKRGLEGQPIFMLWDNWQGHFSHFKGFPRNCFDWREKVGKSDSFKNTRKSQIQPVLDFWFNQSGLSWVQRLKFLQYKLKIIMC